MFFERIQIIFLVKFNMRFSKVNKLKFCFQVKNSFTYYSKENLETKKKATMYSSKSFLDYKRLENVQCNKCTEYNI